MREIQFRSSFERYTRHKHLSIAYNKRKHASRELLNSKV